MEKVTRWDRLRETFRSRGESINKMAQTARNEPKRVERRRSFLRPKKLRKGVLDTKYKRFHLNSDEYRAGG